MRVISFTGSTGGWSQALEKRRRSNLKACNGVGGNAPLIVFEDADIDKAVQGAMLAKMRNLGEACTAANRIYVHKDIEQEFVKKFSAAMGALK